MRTILLCAALLPAGCGQADPTTFQGGNAASWAERLADPARRSEAQETLGAGGDRALGVLVGILERDQGVAGMIAADLAGRLGPRAKGAVPALRNALESQPLKGVAATALGRIGKPARPALPRLKDLCDDPNARVRVAAAAACWRIEGETFEIVARLVHALEQNNPGARRMATETLVEIGGPAVDALAVTLGHKEPSVRAAAATALGAIGPAADRARRPLYSLLKDESALVRRAADEALARIRN